MFPIKPIDAPLYVMLVISNPARYRSRYALYLNSVKHLTDAGAIVYTVEVATGDREFEITSASDPRHIQLRTQHELWHKENMINLGVARLPADWQYVAWVDGDTAFSKPDVVQETVHQLQHYSVVQMFSHAMDLGPNHEPLRVFEGFVAQYMAANGITPNNMEQYGVWHSGYAWACRRDAWDHLGGLIDFAVVGSADRYMACGLIGEMRQAISPDILRECPTYAEQCFEWERRAEHHIRRNIGYVDGLLLHYFHGAKKLRNYVNRNTILWENGFDPSKDIKRDWQGLWQLSDQKIRLRDQLRAYFRSRREDSTDI